MVTTNLLTFQLITGYKRFYVMGIYIPPNDTTGVDALRRAWEACPADCVPLVMGDLNIKFEHPRDAREDDIADLLDEINLVDSSRKFRLRQCRLQSAKRRWTWRQRRLGKWHCSQPDYILARGGIFGTFGRSRSDRRWSTTRIIERLSQHFARGRQNG